MQPAAARACVVRPVIAVDTNPLAGTGPFLWTLRVCVYVTLVGALCLGGPAVRVAAVAGLLLAPLADRAGAMRHVLQLAGLALGLYLIPTLSPLIGQVLKPGLGQTGGAVLSVLGVVFVPTLLGTVVGGVLSWRYRRHRYAYVLNRSLGIVMGPAEGLAVALAACWLFGLFAPAVHMFAMRLSETQPRVGAVLSLIDKLGTTMLVEDSVGVWARDNNPLRRAETLATAAIVSEIAAYREVFWEAFDAGEFDDLLHQPAVRRHYHAFRSNPRLANAARSRDLTTLLTSDEFAAALADDEFCTVAAARWPEVRSRVSNEQISRGRALMARLPANARARLEAAELRAAEFGIVLPR